MAGVSLADIADLMGHKDLATTQIYAKVEQQHLRAVVSKLTPLVPVEVSPESVTRRTNTQDGNTKLLMKKGIGKDWAGLAEREGFGLSYFCKFLPVSSFPLKALSVVDSRRISRVSSIRQNLFGAQRN